jgi:metal-responsive CopG/Arc/MetJ family transcriptional regulator
VGLGAEKIRVSVERGLLAKSDAFAREHGMTRSEMIARGLQAVMVASGES